jgi:hypothetical protein
MYKKFRIKIEEIYNGRVRYTPQVRTGLFKWKNISRYNDDKFEISSDIHGWSSEESEAIKTIEELKKALIEDKLKSIKKVTYKKL